MEMEWNGEGLEEEERKSVESRMIHKHASLDAQMTCVPLTWHWDTRFDVLLLPPCWSLQYTISYPYPTSPFNFHLSMSYSTWEG